MQLILEKRFWKLKLNLIEEEGQLTLERERIFHAYFAIIPKQGKDFRAQFAKEEKILNQNIEKWPS